MATRQIDLTVEAVEEVLRDLGWRSTPSVIDGRRRIYDSTNLIVNVCTPEETIRMLQDRGLIDCAQSLDPVTREVQTAIAFKELV